MELSERKPYHFMETAIRITTAADISTGQGEMLAEIREGVRGCRRRHRGYPRRHQRASHLGRQPGRSSLSWSWSATG